MSPYHIPRDVDAPMPLFFWTAVEIVVAITAAGVGLVMLDSLLLGIIAAGGVLSVAKKMRNENAKRGKAQHMLWRMGVPIESTMNRFPPPLRMEFFE